MGATATLICIVDDEPMIVGILSRRLRRQGYDVLPALSGEVAIALMEANAHELRCLVTDVDLGDEINGWKVARRARELNPSLPVVYVTAKSSHEWSLQGVPQSILITKPFTFSQLLDALRQTGQK